VIIACAYLVGEDGLHELMSRQGIKMNASCAFVNDALIDMYSKCGIERVHLIFSKTCNTKIKCII